MNSILKYKNTGIKMCQKSNKFSFEGNKSKVVRRTVLTYKSGPHFKKV
jgi:hypothetical protein